MVGRAPVHHALVGVALLVFSCVASLPLAGNTCVFLTGQVASIHSKLPSGLSSACR